MNNALVRRSAWLSQCNHARFLNKPSVFSIILYGLFLTASSAESAGNTENNGELLFRNAKALSTNVVNDPKIASPDDLNKSILLYQKVVDQAAGSEWAAKALLTIASLNVLQGKNDQAKLNFNKIINRYHQYEGVTGTALLGLAKLYTEEGDRSKVIEIYERLGANHTWTHTGLGAPLYIAKLYFDNNELEAYHDALIRAAEFYKQNYSSAPTVELRIQAIDYLAGSYEKLEDWEQLLNTLDILMNEKSGVDKPRVMMQIGSLYQYKLDETEKARETYQRLMLDFPLSNLYEEAKARIGEISMVAQKQSLNQQ